MELNDYLTVSQIANKFNVTKRGVYVMAKLYSWRSMKVEGTRFFIKEDVEKTPEGERRGRKSAKGHNI